MKKINKKDLSIQRETVSSLSNETSNAYGDPTQDCIGFTKFTCKNTNVLNTCGETCTTCPSTYTIGCAPDTFYSNCMCGTQGCTRPTEMGCPATTSAQLCCDIPPPVPFSTEPNTCLESGNDNCITMFDCPQTGDDCNTGGISEDYCYTIGECNTQGNCIQTDDNCANTLGCETKNNCETKADCADVALSIKLGCHN